MSKLAKVIRRTTTKEVKALYKRSMEIFAELPLRQRLGVAMRIVLGKVK